MTFYVGQKVVFHAKGTQGTNAVGKQPMKRGRVYTVREIDDRYQLWYEMPGIRVVECCCQPVRWNGIMVEPATLADNFRPAVEHKTDISIFTAMLKTERQPLLTD